jgi:hypothetical protein
VAKGNPTEGVEGARTFRALPAFFAAYNALSAEDRALVDAKFAIFRENPFDARLKTHQINKLSSRYRRTVYSVVIAGDLRALFIAEGNVIITLGIGTHAIYR